MEQHDEKFERENTRIGLLLFAAYVVLFGIAIGIAFLYLAVF
jgi:hypothetical protein